MKGTPWAPRGEDSQAEVQMPEERHRPIIGWNTNTRMVRDFWNEMGKTEGCAGCASPGGKKHNVACLIRQEEWKNRSIPQPEPVTRETGAEMQQDNQAPEPSSSAHTHSTGIGDSTVRPIARHMRDTEQLENANDDPESPGDWTPAKRIRLKSKPLVQSKRPRETPTNLEHMENDDLRRMGTGRTANKRKSDQPEEATVKEQRVDDIVMDQGPRDAGVTNMRMDEMPMDQVMAVSNGTSRVRVNEEKYELATIRGLPADLVRKNQAREMKDLDDMNVLEWVEESTVPKDAQILGDEDEISIRSTSARRLERLRSHETRRSQCTNTHEHDCEMFVDLRGVVRDGSQHIRCESSVHACSCF